MNKNYWEKSFAEILFLHTNISPDPRHPLMSVRTMHFKTIWKLCQCYSTTNGDTVHISLVHSNEPKKLSLGIIAKYQSIILYFPKHNRGK